eukprot:TRINITY_DN1851_c0_g2_i1.p1 TRINITY_DN1851_c0_g2~~TRINITY_DN1851_c0_g2_i1.p1  ORF type:complete len:543 (+),score=36.38 TRINITY_DN1851_c0_g2_i1:45-1673(+)
MATNSTHDLSFLAVGVVICCAFLMTPFRYISINDLLRNLRDGMEFARKRFCSCFAPENDDRHDPIMQYVVREMQGLLERRMVVAYNVYSSFIVLAIAFSLLNTLNHRNRYFNSSQDWCLCIGAVALLLVHHCEWMSPRKAVYRSYAIAMTFCAVIVLLADESQESIIMAGALMVIFRSPFIACGLGCHVVSFWNLLNLSCHAFRLFRSPKIESTMPVSLLLFDVTATIFIIFGTEGFHWVAWETIYQEALSKSDKLEHNAMGSLMDIVCDVTLSLDKDLTITGDSRRFAAMIMFDSTRSLEGVSIEQYIPLEADRQRFRHQFTIESNKGAHGVVCMNVNLRDCSGHQVCVEMFGIAFKGLDVSDRYILGMRECADLHLAPVRRKYSRPHESNEQQTVAESSTTPQEGGLPLAQGTPAVRGRSEPAQEMCANSCPSSRSNRSNKAVLAIPSMLETPLEVKYETLIALLATWNVRVARCDCCPLHASLNDLKALTSRLKKGKCQQQFYAYVKDQCTSCGVLDSLIVGNECTHCGSCNAGAIMRM